MGWHQHEHAGRWAHRCGRASMYVSEQSRRIEAYILGGCAALFCRSARRYCPRLRPLSYGVPTQTHSIRAAPGPYMERADALSTRSTARRFITGDPK